MKKINIKRSLILLWLFTPAFGFAQSGSSGFYSELLATLITGASLVVILAALYAIYRLFSVMVRMKEIEIYEKHGLTEYLEEKKANEGSWWQRFSRKMTDAVPVAKEKDILFDHEYDGIRELDNNLPPWWLYGFYLTIAIAIVYMGYYHFSSYGESSTEMYEREMAVAKAQVDEYLSKQADQIDENNVVALTDELSLADGQEIFKTLCAVCHLEHGGGGPGSVGPNLTDAYWLNGGSMVDIFKTIKHGVPEKGMIAWKAQLRPAEIHKVASYITTLQGTNPPGAKEAQGELYEPESKVEVETGEEAVSEIEE